MTRSNPPAIIFPAHIPAFATLALGSALPLHPQHALHTFSSLHHTLPCRPPNPDTISRLFSPPFPTFRRSLSLRPVGGRALIGLSSEMVVGGWLQLDARRKPRVAVWRWRRWGSRTHSPAECMLYVRMCACRRLDCMSHGERAYPHGQRRKGRERRGRRNRCKKFGDAKMRFQKVAATFPCAAHANSFTRVPGRNAAPTNPEYELYGIRTSGQGERPHRL